MRPLDLLNSPELRDSLINYVEANKGADPDRLALNAGGDESRYPFPLPFALMQIESRRRFSHKMPRLLSCREILFPDRLVGEQASDERLAAYNASLAIPGERGADLTAGLGIDAIALAERCSEVTAIELDHMRAAALSHNMEAAVSQLKVGKIKVEEGDCISWLTTHAMEPAGRGYGTLFIDPARRSEGGSRLYALRDCIPDVTAMMPRMRAAARRVIIKASPMLDLSTVREDLPATSEIHMVCIKGECKELLIVVDSCQSDTQGGFRGVSCLDLERHTKLHALPEEIPGFAEYEKPRIEYARARIGEWLYEPDAGVMKTQCWGALLRCWPDLRKLDPNTHLFVAPEKYPGFPGRVTRILSIPSRSELVRMKGVKMNVCVRNYPLTAAQLAAKWGIHAGYKEFMYGCRQGGKPLILITASE